MEELLPISMPIGRVAEWRSCFEMFVQTTVKELSPEFQHAQMQFKRINKIFKETGLLELFERSKGETLVILSLAAGMCVELEFVRYYAKIYQFQFHYYYVDSSKQAVQIVKESYADEERAHFAWTDACDRECIATAHPELQDQSADIVFLLNPELTRDAYPFWKMYFDIIPRLAKPNGHIVTTFLYDHEKDAFLRHANKPSAQYVFQVTLCCSIDDDYSGKEYDSWYARISLQKDAISYVKSSFKDEESSLYFTFKEAVAVSIMTPGFFNGCKLPYQETIDQVFYARREIGFKKRQAMQAGKEYIRPELPMMPSLFSHNTHPPIPSFKLLFSTQASKKNTSMDELTKHLFINREARSAEWALRYYALKGSLPHLKKLLELKPDVDLFAKSKKQQTAYDIAMTNEHKECAEYLEKKMMEKTKGNSH